MYSKYPLSHWTLAVVQTRLHHSSFSRLIEWRWNLCVPFWRIRQKGYSQPINRVHRMYKYSSNGFCREATRVSFGINVLVQTEKDELKTWIRTAKVAWSTLIHFDGSVLREALSEMCISVLLLVLYLMTGTSKQSCLVTIPAHVPIWQQVLLTRTRSRSYISFKYCR